MSKEIKINESCHCAEYGKDGTTEHSGNETLLHCLIEYQTIDCYTKSCENHLNNYLRTNYWITVKEIPKV